MIKKVQPEMRVRCCRWWPYGTWFMGVLPRLAGGGLPLEMRQATIGSLACVWERGTPARGLKAACLIDCRAMSLTGMIRKIGAYPWSS